MLSNTTGSIPENKISQTIVPAHLKQETQSSSIIENQRLAKISSAILLITIACCCCYHFRVFTDSAYCEHWFECHCIIGCCPLSS